MPSRPLPSSAKTRITQDDLAFSSDVSEEEADVKPFIPKRELHSPSPAPPAAVGSRSRPLARRALLVASPSPSLSPVPAPAPAPASSRVIVARSRSRSNRGISIPIPAQPDEPAPPLPLPPSNPPRINRVSHTARRPTHLIVDSPESTAGSSVSSGGASPTGAGTGAAGDGIGNGKLRRAIPVPLAQASQSSSDSSIMALDDEQVAALSPSTREGRRYTRAEKGKGRAVVDAEVEVLPKGVGMKRKNGGEQGGREGKRTAMAGGRGGEEEVDELDSTDEEEVEEEEEGQGMEDLACPVCFDSMSRPVSTLCGHAFCANCLHGTLLSAIGRSANPLPLSYPGPGPARPPARPRATHTRAKHKTDPVHNPLPESTDAQPYEWSMTTLQAHVVRERQKRREEMERAAERQFEAAGMERENWEAAKMGLGITGEGAQDPEGGKGLVVELLKGLWRIPGGVVIEGECPVCRNAIPGGMGPMGSGVGSVTPLTSWLEVR